MSLVDWIYPRKCINCGMNSQYACQRCRGLIERRGTSLHYTGVVRKMIKAIKYRGTHDMIKELVEIWNPRRPDGEWVVTAVPMWEPKKKLRGFNQAELIARVVARKWGMEYRELLVRVRETKPMYGLTKQQRAENIKGAFEVNSNIKNQKSKQVILVDDVWTTGATIGECERVLKRVGVERVWGITVAQ